MLSVSDSEARGLVGKFAEIAVQFKDPSVIWPTMLEQLERSIGFDAGYIAATWDTASNGRGAVAEYDPWFIKQNLGRYLSEILPEEVARYTCSARVHHDVWSPRRQNELAVFREVLQPSGMKHMIVRVSIQRGNVAGFNLERRDGTPFTERELALVDLVAPFLHIAEVLTLTEQKACVSAEFRREHRLTEREGDFVALASRGLQNGEIALLLHVSVNTVRNTLARIFEKVGVSNRTELAHLATESCSPSPLQAGGSAAHPADPLRGFVARVEHAAAKREGGSSGGVATVRGSSGRVRMFYAPPLTESLLQR